MLARPRTNGSLPKACGSPAGGEEDGSCTAASHTCARKEAGSRERDQSLATRLADRLWQTSRAGVGAPVLLVATVDGSDSNHPLSACTPALAFAPSPSFPPTIPLTVDALESSAPRSLLDRFSFCSTTNRSNSRSYLSLAAASLGSLSMPLTELFRTVQPSASSTALAPPHRPASPSPGRSRRSECALALLLTATPPG